MIKAVPILLYMQEKTWYYKLRRKGERGNGRTQQQTGCPPYFKTGKYA